MRANLVLILAVGIALTSCQKSKTDYTTLGQDSALSQSVSSDVFNNLDNNAKNNSQVSGKKQGGSQTNATCATVTINTTGGGFPITMTVDFGSGCADNGVTRSGKLIGVFTGFYTDSGTMVSVTTDNYYVNGYKVEGTKTITNKGRDNNQHLYFTVVDADGKVTKPTGGVVTWTSNYTQTWTAGESTPLNFCDDVYSITGTAGGTDSKGDSYTLSTPDANHPLVKDICCYWLQSGILSLSVNGAQIGTIDYSYTLGLSSCDSWATITYGGKNYNVGLY